jgi:hypothetical protein
VAGTYTWTTHYSGDANNNGVTEVGSATNHEQTVVASAAPTLVGTATPAMLTLSASPPPTLTDSATISDGLDPTGTITLTLAGPGGSTVDTETIAVHGDGTYATPTGFKLPTTGTVAGTYTWSAAYNGDANNNRVTEVGSATNQEQTVVAPAAPTLVATASPKTVTLGADPTLIDTATLSGGFHPTGTITFTLAGPGGSKVDTETVTLNGNGTYPTPTGFILPTTGAVAGTYSWTAHYSGDANNNPANENPSGERTVVLTAAPAAAVPPASVPPAPAPPAPPLAVAPSSSAPASPAPAASTPGALAFTGAIQSTLVEFAAAAIAAGLILTAVTRRRKQRHDQP